VSGDGQAIEDAVDNCVGAIVVLTSVTTTTTTSTTMAPTTYTIEVAPNNILAYVPSTLVIHTGDTVVFSYDQTSNSHTVTTGTHCIHDQKPLFNFSSTGPYTFTAPGVYGCFCTVGSHSASGERGTITVE
jgi:plastocyanin